MQDLDKYIFESNIKSSYNISLNLLEMLAYYVMIDVTDCVEPMKETKHKLEMSLRSHATYILRECPDIAKKYDYKTLFSEKSKDEVNELLDIIISEMRVRKK
jgi:hypothetical protein